MSASSRPFFRSLTGVFVVAGLLALTAALALGAGGPAGFPFLLAASAAFGLAVVHSWRGPRKFLWLAGASAGGFLLFVVLHNLFYALGEVAAETPVLAAGCEALHVAAFLLAVAVCPVLFVIGLVGALVTCVGGRWHPTR